jgi:hypothetical protein
MGWWIEPLCYFCVYGGRLKLAGFLLMLAGWIIAVSAIGLLHSLPAQTAFLLAGIAIEIVGFVLVARQHIPKPRSKGDA